MSQIVRCALIQAANPINDESVSVADIQKAMLDKHLPMIEEAGKKGVQILGLQEIFNGPYFCPSQDKRWYEAAEPIPGPTTELMQSYAKKYSMVMVVPLYEKEMRGVFYNSAAVIDADGKYLGKYRKQHIPQVAGFGKSTFSNLATVGIRSLKPSTLKLVCTFVTIDTFRRERVVWDSMVPRSFSTPARQWLDSPNTFGRSSNRRMRWPTVTMSRASNRVGKEGPWNIGEFYGTSYFVNPRGEIVAEASQTEDELLIAELDLGVIDEVRQTWQFYRDRRPDAYDELVRP